MHKYINFYNIKNVTGILAIVMMYVVLESFGITCPIKYVMGISCAGCGMSRAWIALLHLNINDAFKYHPLFMLPPIALTLIIRKKQINIKVYKILMSIIICIFIAVYLYRMIAGGDSIVVFEPQNNIIFRLMKKIKS